MKSERGSITLYVLISMIFFLIIAMTAYVSAMSKLQGQNSEIEQIKSSYEQDLSADGLLNLYNKATKTRQWLVGSGTKEDTYKIYKIEDLLEFSNRVNGGENFSGKYIELMNDLDFRKDGSYEKADRTDFGDVNNNGTVEPLKTELTTGEGWQAIGTDTVHFTGSFEGNKHEIINLFINSSKKYSGLFGRTEGTIQNLNISGRITSTGEYAGGIAGYNSNIINHCLSNIKIEQTISNNNWSYCGGIAGTSHRKYK